MSLFLLSQTIIGCEVCVSNLKRVWTKGTITRGCSHEIREKDNFCSQCGQPAYLVKSDELIEETYERFKDGKLGPFVVAHSIDKNRAVLGRERLESQVENCIQFSVIPENSREFEFFIENTREQLRAFLEPIGLWNPQKFGLYNVLYVNN